MNIKDEATRTRLASALKSMPPGAYGARVDEARHGALDRLRDGRLALSGLELSDAHRVAVEALLERAETDPPHAFSRAEERALVEVADRIGLLAEHLAGLPALSGYSVSSDVPRLGHLVTKPDACLPTPEELEVAASIGITYEQLVEAKLVMEREARAATVGGDLTVADVARQLGLESGAVAASKRAL